MSQLSTYPPTPLAYACTHGVAGPHGAYRVLETSVRIPESGLCAFLADLNSDSPPLVALDPPFVGGFTGVAADAFGVSFGLLSELDCAELFVDRWSVDGERSA